MDTLRLAAFALLLATAPAAVAADLPRGVMVEKVTCQNAPEQAYALYLPSSYTPDRKWPILYAFDARADGSTVAGLFRRAAERYGWIVVSSWSTESDVGGERPMEGNFTAMRALWADTHARFAVDDARVYLAGFSGTVRFSCILGLTAPGTIAGVIGASAGFPIGTRPKKDNPFAFYGTYGDRDFNYYEVRDLDRTLTDLGVPHRMEGFAGTHSWMPEELAYRAVGWMELEAMRKGLRPKDAAMIEEAWAVDLAQAQAQAASHPADALHTWRALMADFTGLRDAADVERAQKEAAALAASPACQKEVRERAERDQRDQEALAAAPGILARSNPGNEPVTVAQIAAALRIPELKKRRDSSDVEESLSAHRLLNTYLGQTAFYQPQAFLEKKEYDRALFMVMLATEIDPASPGLWVEVASIQMLKGKAGRKKALEALREALDRGMRNPKTLEAEDFLPLRGEPEFQEIQRIVKERQAAAPAPPAG